MHRRFRHIVASAVVALALAAPAAGHAEGYCDSHFYFFGSSKPAAGPTVPNPVAYPGVYCIADSSDTAGEAPNQLLPTNNLFYIRYTIDQGAAIPSINVVVNGAGFTNQGVTLKRTALTGGTGYAYDGPTIAIPGTGCIRVTQADLEEEGHIATFGASC